MVKVTFDYGNKEDHKLVMEMIGEPVTVSAHGPSYETLVEKVAAEKKPVAPAVKPGIPAHGIKPEPVVPASERPAPGGAKTITAAEALPKVAAYCQANGLDKPQAYFARIGKGNIHELTPEQIVELLTELGIEV